MLIAKAEVDFDKVKGEMNKKAKIFTTELVRTCRKRLVDIEATLVNIIKNTIVRGYEVWKQSRLTKNGYYRG